MADYDYLPVSDGTGDAALMHISADRLTGASTLKVDVVTKVPSKFIATTGTLLPSGYIDPATAKNFKGHLSGSDIIIDAFEAGSTDTGNVIGQVVVIKPNTPWANRVASFIKNATGLGTPEPLTASTLVVSSGTTLPAGDIGTADVANGAITPAKISVPVWQYLASAINATNSVITSSGATPTLITDLTVPATIPSNATAVKITIQLQNLYIQTGSGLANIYIYKGSTAGALTTQIAGANGNAGTGGGFGVIPMSLVTIIKDPVVIEALGSTNFSAAFSSTVSNAKTDTSSVAPALILIEVC